MVIRNDLEVELTDKLNKAITNKDGREFKERYPVVGWDPVNDKILFINAANNFDSESAYNLKVYIKESVKINWQTGSPIGIGPAMGQAIPLHNTMQASGTIIADKVITNEIQPKVPETMPKEEGVYSKEILDKEYAPEVKGTITPKPKEIKKVR